MDEKCGLASQWSQYCPMQVHATKSDCIAALSACFDLRSRRRAQEEAERAWCPDGRALALLSVRSGIDLLCRCYAWPEGSEVIVTALNIPDVPRILRCHGLRCVPWDIDLQTLSPDPSTLDGLVTGRTVAVLVAHVFGARADMQPIVEAARRRGLAVVEDCAEAWSGPGGYRGCDEADVSLFSFGPVKYDTAFQGGVLRCRDRALLQRMRGAQAGWPVQGRAAYFARCARFTVYVLLQHPLLIGAIMRALRILGFDHQRLFVWLIRSFAAARRDQEYLGRLRQRPSAPLLLMLLRRFRGPGGGGGGNQRAGRLVAGLLGGAGGVEVPGSRAKEHTYWLFPVLCGGGKSAATVAAGLRGEGVDASTGSSQIAVVPSEVDAARGAPQAESLMRRVVYLPVGGNVPEWRLRETARLNNIPYQY